MKLPYIKPTRRKHDSGFKIFEVGYCNVKNGKAIDIEIKGQCSDHIWMYGSIVDCLKSLEHCKNYRVPKSISMDLTTNGYIRLFSRDTKNCTLKWENDSCIVSSATLVLIEEVNNPMTDVQREYTEEWKTILEKMLTTSDLLSDESRTKIEDKLKLINAELKGEE